ncbi:hypothetical protein MMC16_000492 [Acarospora aff. strigata]|nr:hypothetical protein [Acarospora aff. strigata]
MFLFNRGASSSQHTRKASGDSVQVVQTSSRRATPSPSPRASTGEWSPQRRRRDTEGTKRTSVFASRQRSNTIASSLSLNSTTSSTELVGKYWWRGSREKHSKPEGMLSRGERSESMTMSLISRSSRMLKRQNSTLTSLRTLDGVDVTDRSRGVQEIQELYGRTYTHHERSESIDSEGTRKRNISEPYNFQHLTHANAKHLPELQRATEHELVTEFSAIRASQAPRRELRGIKAENLHFKNFSSETLQQDASNSSVMNPTTPPPLSPKKSTELLRRESPSPLGAGRSSRYARSVENFSLPGPKSPRSPLSPIVPPPRTSSRAAMTIAFEPSLALLDSPTAPAFPRPLTGPVAFNLHDADSTTHSPHGGTFTSTDISAGHMILPHAVTTPDDSALQLLPLPFGTPGTELADVPEEEEDYFRKRNSVRSSRPSTAGSALRHAQSFPSIKQSFERPISQQSLRGFCEEKGQQQRPISSASNTLGSPFRTKLPADQRRPSMPSRRVSKNLKGIEGSWEDDIDYCYQHAAEADCDFDWDRKSRDGGDGGDASYHVDDSQFRAKQLLMGNDRVRINTQHVGASKDKVFREDFGSSSFQSTDIAVPDLEPSSALSESTSGAGPPTPSLTLLPRRPVEMPIRPSKSSEGFCLSPSLLISSDYEAQMLDEAMYQEMLGDGANSDKHYPFYSQGEDTAESRTESPLSKCNSQESMVISRAASAQQTHRSTNSSGSLPELVHSKNSRERFDIAADQLAEQIASFSTAEAGADPQRSISPLHKRGISLAKEVAHQSMLKKATSNISADGFDAPAPLIQSLRPRERSCSDEAVKVLPTTSTGPSGPPLAKRLRSSSAATTASSRRSSRVSYTLFPTCTIRSSS